MAAARRLAADAHRGQLDKFGRPYFEGHIEEVADLVQKWDAAHEAVAAALLHDVVEKTNLTADDLAAAGMPARVLELVGLLTHHEGQPRAAYITAILRDADAKLVKRADHLANANPVLLARLPAQRAAALRHRYERERRHLFGPN